MLEFWEKTFGVPREECVAVLTHESDRRCRDFLAAHNRPQLMVSSEDEVERTMVWNILTGGRQPMPFGTVLAGSLGLQVGKAGACRGKNVNKEKSGETPRGGLRGMDTDLRGIQKSCNALNAIVLSMASEGFV